jgi:hypothetical protein
LRVYLHALLLYFYVCVVNEIRASLLIVLGIDQSLIWESWLQSCDNFFYIEVLVLTRSYSSEFSAVKSKKKFWMKFFEMQITYTCACVLIVDNNFFLPSSSGKLYNFQFFRHSKWRNLTNLEWYYQWFIAGLSRMIFFEILVFSQWWEFIGV